MYGSSYQGFAGFLKHLAENWNALLMVPAITGCLGGGVAMLGGFPVVAVAAGVAAIFFILCNVLFLVSLRRLREAENVVTGAAAQYVASAGSERAAAARQSAVSAVGKKGVAKQMFLAFGASLAGPEPSSDEIEAFRLGHNVSARFSPVGISYNTADETTMFALGIVDGTLDGNKLGSDQ